MRIIVDQGFLHQAGAAQVPTVLAGILATGLFADAFEGFLDLAVLAPHAAALLPLAGVPTPEQIRLALAWFSRDNTNVHVRTFLRNQVTHPANAPVAFTPAVSAEIRNASRTDREILDLLGFAQGAVAAPVAPGVAPLPLGNLALSGSPTNTLLVTGRPYLATVTAAPNCIVRRNPTQPASGFMTLVNGANVRVTGSSGTWRAVDVWGQLGFIDAADLSPPPP